MHVTPFDPELAELIGSWARTPEEALWWCSRQEAPVPAAVVRGWASEPDVQAFVLLDGEKPVAYGEVWLDADEEEAELARLVVEPARRGQGLGRALVGELTRTARTSYPTVTVRVHRDNEAALRSYAGAGFHRVDADTEAEWNTGQPVRYAWMLHRP